MELHCILAWLFVGIFSNQGLATPAIDGTATRLSITGSELAFCSPAPIIVHGETASDLQLDLQTLKKINDLVTALFPPQGSKSFPDLSKKYTGDADHCANPASLQASVAAAPLLGNNENAFVLAGETVVVCAPTIKGLSFDVEQLSKDVDTLAHQDLPYSVNSTLATEIRQLKDDFMDSRGNRLITECKELINNATQSKVFRGKNNTLYVTAIEEIEFENPTVFVESVDIGGLVSELQSIVMTVLQTSPSRSRISGVSFQAQSDAAFSFSQGIKLLNGGILEIDSNGNRGDYWQAQGVPQWVTFAVPQEVGFIRMYCWRQSCPFGVEIQYSSTRNSGFVTHHQAEFQPVTRADNYKGWTWMALPRLSSAYLRVRINYTFEPSHWTTAAEIEFFNGCDATQLLLPSSVDEGVASQISYGCIPIPTESL